MATADRSQTTDEYIETLTAVHGELAEDLSRLRAEAGMEAATGTAWDVAFTERRLALVAAEIAEVSGEVLGEDGEDGLAAQAVDEAYSVGLATNDVAAEAQGVTIPPDDEAFEDLHTVQARAIAQELTDGYEGLYSTILRTEADRYQRIQARATMQGILTGETISDTMLRLLEQFEAEDITGFVDRAGRQWKLENYAANLARTVPMKANRTASLTRTAELGIDLVMVVGGEIATTCVTCDRLDGKILSINGPPDPLPPNYGGTLAAAEASHPPLGHNHCIHSYVAWVPDAGPSDEELRKLTEETAELMGLSLNPPEAVQANVADEDAVPLSERTPAEQEEHERATEEAEEV